MGPAGTNRSSSTGRSFSATAARRNHSTAADGGLALELETSEREQRFDLVGRRRYVEDALLTTAAFEAKREREIACAKPSNLEPRGQPLECGSQQERQRLEGIDRIAAIHALLEALRPG